MKRIYKYPFQNRRVADIYLPVGAQVLTVQEQHGDLVLWALVEPDNDVEKRSFVTVLTGVESFNWPDPTYLATIQSEGGTFVRHVFEVKP